MKENVEDIIDHLFDLYLDKLIVCNVFKPEYRELEKKLFEYHYNMKDFQKDFDKANGNIDSAFSVLINCQKAVRDFLLAPFKQQVAPLIDKILKEADPAVSCYLLEKKDQWLRERINKYGDYTTKLRKAVVELKRAKDQLTRIAECRIDKIARQQARIEKLQQDNLELQQQNNRLAPNAVLVERETLLNLDEIPTATLVNQETTTGQTTPRAGRPSSGPSWANFRERSERTPQRRPNRPTRRR